MAILQRQSQTQRLQQRADPQLLMTNRMLQMSAMELQQCLVQELAENPALEAPEDQGFGFCPVHGSDCTGCELSQSLKASAADKAKERATPRVADDTDLLDPLDLAEAPQTLRDHLLTQFGAVSAPSDAVVGHYLIDNIDDDGYLGCAVEDAARTLEVSVGEVERVLAIIQSLDPSGVGARSLQECLLIQARAYAAEGGAPQFLEPLLARYWKELVGAKFRLIARGLRCTPGEVERTVLWLRRNLSPHPGSQYRPRWQKSGSRSAQSIRPDVMVFLDDDGRLALEVAGEELPEVQLNPYYARMWQQMRDRAESLSEAERKHVRDFVFRAQMFLKGLQDRKTILQRVAACIISEQERYFHSEQDEDLMPLTQSELSSFLRVHESTVSRAVAEKYLQLPSGRVVPFSLFFDRALGMRKLVANVVASEDPSSPYSDQEISDILRRQGVSIARRTVMKYREEMNILSSRQRARTAR